MNEFAFKEIGEANGGLRLYTATPIRWSTTHTSPSTKVTLDLYSSDKSTKIVSLVSNYAITAKEAIVRPHKAEPFKKYRVRANVAGTTIWSNEIDVRVCNTFNMARIEVCRP